MTVTASVPSGADAAYVVTFPAFLLGRFSGRVMENGVHLGPEAALEALARENISFTVKGNAGYEQRVAATRGAAPAPF
jgi:hypothetical protein